MERRTLLVSLLVLSGALLVPTAALPFEEPDRVHPDLALEPADGPNGGYAVADADGELALRLDGSNPAVDGGGVPDGVRTPIEGVFTITYTGETAATVWITDDTADVTFFHGDDPADSLEGESNAVVLAPGEGVTVGLLVDTRGANDVADADTFGVEAQLADPDPSFSRVAVSGSSSGSDTPTPTPAAGTPPPTATPTATPSPTPTATATPTPAATGTPASTSGTETADTPSPTVTPDAATTTPEERAAQAETGTPTPTAAPSVTPADGTSTPTSTPVGVSFGLDPVAVAAGGGALLLTGLGIAAFRLDLLSR